MISMFILCASVLLHAMATDGRGTTVVQLPHYIGNHVLFGSVIEFDAQIDTFFAVVFVLNAVGRRVVETKANSSAVLSSIRKRRIRFADANEDSLDCAITSSLAPQSYVVTPVIITPGNPSNKYFDILRCPVPKMVMDLDSDQTGHLNVKLMHSSKWSVEFTISSQLRHAGYLMSQSTVTHEGNISGAPSYFTLKKENSSDKTESGKKFHLLVPCVSQPFSRYLALQLIEFIQHHILVGIDHIVIGFPFEKNSRDMDLIQQSLGSFVISNHLTIVSLIENSTTTSRLKTTKDVLIYRRIVEMVFSNMFLYLSRGIASHVGIWTERSFLIPRSPFRSIRPIVHRLNAENGALLANGHPHPPCHFLIRQRLLYHDLPSINYNHQWRGSMFPERLVELENVISNREGLIIPTDTIFRIGITGYPEACKLPAAYTTCWSQRTDGANLACVGKPKPRHMRGRLAAFDDSSKFHDMDDLVMREDALLVDEARDASLVIFLNKNRENEKMKSGNVINEYKLHYYEKVLRALKSRGIEVFMSLPLTETQMQPSKLDVDWVDSQIVNTVAPEKLDGTASSYSAYNTLEELPNFASDFSEFFLGSLIERKADSLDLHLTVFMMSHKIVKDLNHMEGIENTQLGTWRRFLEKSAVVRYSQSGLRVRSESFHCRMKNDKESNEFYTSDAHFIPNRVSPDANANGNTDILRCPIFNTRHAYTTLAGTNNHISVEIFHGEQSLIKFTVPWSTRGTGYMLSSPDKFSKFDAWLGIDKLLSQNGLQSLNKNPNRKGGEDRSDLFMCVGGMESPFDRRLLPLYAEFLEHHYQLGVKHTFIAAAYTWSGPHMKNVHRAFSSYISDSMLSVTSTAVGVGASDLTYSVNGISMGRDTVKVIFSNMCLYHAKGTADYVGVWDFDEFFIPRLPHNSIMDVVLALDTYVDDWKNISEMSNIQLLGMARSWKGARGFADGDGHRACYILLDSETITTSPTPKKDAVWIGQLYDHGSHKSSMSFQKPIFPTDRIWQASLHVGGACSLPSPWSKCEGIKTQSHREDFARSKEFCYLSVEDIRRIEQSVFSRNKAMMFSGFHFIDELVREEDAKRAKIQSDALIYHIQVHRTYLVTEKDHAHVLDQENEYSSRFFDAVYSGLVKRGIAVLMELPLNLARIDRFSELQWPMFTVPRENQLSLIANRKHTIPAITSLPSFSWDNTEYIFSALIERASDDPSMHITTFLLSHSMMSADIHKGRMKRNPATASEWNIFAAESQKTKYTESGVRIMKDPFKCRITNDFDGNSVEYYSNVELIPNKLTPDSNANRRLDILRCLLADSDAAYSSLAGSKKRLFVEILKGSVSLVQFTIPWSVRRTGYMMEPNHDTLLDPWIGAIQGFPSGAFKESSGKHRDRDDIQMCVPGLESPPDRNVLPLYAEFIQHHILLGVKHFHIGTMFSHNSTSMRDLMQILKSFITDGFVTVTTQTDGELDLTYSTSGLTFDRDDSKIFFVNMCLYYAKGAADYVGIWDFDEFFIPRAPFGSIMDVVHSMEAINGKIDLNYLKNVPIDEAKKMYKGGLGLADGDGHPFCYILLQSESVHNDPLQPSFDGDNPWIGQRFDHNPEIKSSHAFKKSILPTKTIFYAGLHMSAACKLDHPYNGCDTGNSRGSTSTFCYSDKPRDFYGLSYTGDNRQVDFSLYQVFNGVILDKDAKQMKPATQGVIYHFQYHRATLFTALMTGQSDERNDYSRIFFPKVLSELERRGVVALEYFPTLMRRGDNVLFGPKWTKYKTFLGKKK